MCVGEPHMHFAPDRAYVVGGALLSAFIARDGRTENGVRGEILSLIRDVVLRLGTANFVISGPFICPFNVRPIDEATVEMCTRYIRCWARWHTHPHAHTYTLSHTRILEPHAVAGWRCTTTIAVSELTISRAVHWLAHLLPLVRCRNNFWIEEWLDFFLFGFFFFFLFLLSLLSFPTQFRDLKNQLFPFLALLTRK